MTINLEDKSMGSRKNPHVEKQRARRKLRSAIKNGRVVKLPCAMCGSTASQAHHEDYSRPTDVVWLCAKHHMARHLDSMPDNSGEKNGQAKLTAAIVEELRARYWAARANTHKWARGKISQRALAHHYGVAQGVVFRIVHSLTWRRIMTKQKRKDPHAVILGRRGGKVGGKVTSPAKARAARRNGRKGGRPRKVAA
jgi:hypothetical protein